MEKYEIRELDNALVTREMLRAIRANSYVESVDSLGINDGKMHTWYVVRFKDGNTVDVLAPKYNVD